MIICFHEHELKSNADTFRYETEVSATLSRLNINGLIQAYLLKGLKGERSCAYAVLWFFSNIEAIENNFGTLDNPKWPDDWLYYENEILAKYLTVHPDKIHFTDYGIVQHFNYSDRSDSFDLRNV